MRRIRNTKGFTLIELMIVVVIIGILAAIALPRFGNVSRNAREAEAGPILRQICTLQQVRFEQEGAFAANIAGLTTFVDPVARSYTFTTAVVDGQATAIATRRTGEQFAALRNQTLNCATNVVTNPS